MIPRSDKPGGLRLSELPVLALGFRPFYLVAAIFAVLALPLWMAWYAGVLPPTPALTGLTWHIHEMIFGFAPAVMAGFLLTAVRNWTGQRTATGAVLASMVALWIAGRVLMVTGPLPVAAAVDLMFLPAVGIAIAIPIWRSRNTRNVKVLVIVAALTLANAQFHLANLGVLPYALLNTAPVLALDIIAILIAVMGGRVIPAFTKNAIPTANVRHDPRVEVVAIGSLLLIAVGDLLNPWWPMPAGIWVVLFAAAAVSHGIRLAMWAPHRTVRQPLLLMLPVAYAWMPISFALGAFARLGTLPPAMQIHALTIGAMSSLMLAMMTRSALGHTGRPLSAGPAETSAIVLLQLAALARVFAGLLPPETYRGVVMASGLLWTLAFAVFLFAYWPILTRPRIDGRPG